MNKLLVTGSSGLIGSEVVDYFCKEGWQVYGIDNNQRADFFGPAGDTRWNQKRLLERHQNFQHVELDIRDRLGILNCIKSLKPDMLVHTAAQPSHDLAASRPFDDFDVNAVGTLNLLEAVNKHVPEAVFIHMSTNKVYGDRPNTIPLKELDTRCAEVYNLGGGRQNSCSILEAFERIAALSGKKMQYEYVEKNREGDHICYISDLSKMQAQYPEWSLTKSLDDIFEEIYKSWQHRL